MAGSGVLALPGAMVGTGNEKSYYDFMSRHVLQFQKWIKIYFNGFIILGWAGAFLIFIFTANACFSGTRLGSCWTILEERYEEFQREIRDPYPSIGEKAVGRWGR